jgi:gamma-glutamylaminecyclotransferase
MTNKKFKPFNIAVYGTLREGFNNNKYYLNGCKKVKTSKTDELFTMYSNGGFPIISPNGPKPTNIVVDLYEIDNEDTIKNIDALEGYPGWYDKMDVTVEGEKVPIYFMDNVNNLPIVESGDWSKYKK